MTLYWQPLNSLTLLYKIEMLSVELNRLCGIPSHSVDAIDVSPDGTLIAYSIMDIVIIECVGDRDFQSFLRNHETPVGVIKFSPNSSLLASGDQICNSEPRAASVYIWNTSTSDCLWHLSGDNTNISYGICHLCWTPDSSIILISGGNGQLTGAIIDEPKLKYIGSITFDEPINHIVMQNTLNGKYIEPSKFIEDGLEIGSFSEVSLNSFNNRIPKLINKNSNYLPKKNSQVFSMNTLNKNNSSINKRPKIPSHGLSRQFNTSFNKRTNLIKNKFLKNDTTSSSYSKNNFETSTGFTDQEIFLFKSQISKLNNRFTLMNEVKPINSIQRFSKQNCLYSLTKKSNNNFPSRYFSISRGKNKLCNHFKFPLFYDGKKLSKNTNSIVKNENIIFAGTTYINKHRNMRDRALYQGAIIIDKHIVSFILEYDQLSFNYQWKSSAMKLPATGLLRNFCGGVCLGKLSLIGVATQAGELCIFNITTSTYVGLVTISNVALTSITSDKNIILAGTNDGCTIHIQCLIPNDLAAPSQRKYQRGSDNQNSPTNHSDSLMKQIQNNVKVIKIEQLITESIRKLWYNEYLTAIYTSSNILMEKSGIHMLSGFNGAVRCSQAAPFCSDIVIYGGQNGEAGSIIILETQDYHPLLQLSHTSPITAIVFYYCTQKNGKEEIIVWDLKNFPEKNLKLKDFVDITKINDIGIAFGDETGTVHGGTIAHFAQNRKPLWSSSDGHRGSVTALLYSRNCILSGGEDGKVNFWIPNEFQSVATLKLHSSAITGIALRPYTTIPPPSGFSDYILYTSAVDGTLSSYDIGFNKLDTTHYMKTALLGVSLRKDNETEAVCCTADGLFVQFDRRKTDPVTVTFISEQEIKKNICSAYSLSPCGTLAVAAASNRYLYLYDVRKNCLKFVRVL